MTRTARLYPANETTAFGVVIATFAASGVGNGEITATLPDGEFFKGEYAITRGGAVGFGGVFGSIYSPASSASYSGISHTYVSEGKSQGVAFAQGNKGTRLDCEFLNDNWSGHGYGACKTSTGALYKLAY